MSLLTDVRSPSHHIIYSLIEYVPVLTAGTRRKVNTTCLIKKRNMPRKLLLVLCLVPTLGYCFTTQRSPDRQISALSMARDETLKIFPVSIRSALLENAKLVDESIAKGERKGSYSPAGWSNRLGTALTPASIPGVYTGDRPFYWNKIDVGCRMTVVQLEGGDLWVHTPVSLDKSLKEALDKLGTVKYIVCSNYEHLRYAPQWHKAYPDAFMWGCPGLSERVPEIRWTGEIPSQMLRPGDTALEDCWDFNTIRPLHLDMEVNPFTGKPFFNEVIFYHVPSKTLMTTDLWWNYPTSDGVPNSHLGGSEWELAPSVESIPLGSALWKQGMDRIFLPFYKNFMVKDRARFNEIAKVVLDEWEIETLIPAHGDIVRGADLIQLILSKHLKID
jgi:hypothetical protein